MSAQPFPATRLADVLGAVADASAAAAPVAQPSPARIVWRRFRAHRLGYWSLWLLGLLFAVSLCGEVLSNDRPLLVRYEGQWFAPVLHSYPETAFGGVLDTPADFHDPFVQAQLARSGNFVLRAPNPWYYDTMKYQTALPHPSPPSAENWLGTDIIGRDVLARLLYAVRVSLLFGLALTASGVLLGVALGALQGYFGGRVDLVTQRLIEIWGSLPELYLLIIFASFFEPSLLLLFVLLSLFGWIGLSDYVRAEFLRNRQLEYVKAARAMGLSSGQIIWRHILPNSLTPVITFLPFRVSAAIMALTSLDFLGLGVQPPTPSLGDLFAQAKTYLYAWWISVPTFAVLVATLLLLTFIGQALREALDTRIDAPGAQAGPAEDAA
ncbi:ABC transporter permease [Acidovorax sp. YS12]|nr:ABC transporter permease [Acidovorax sp. YS12]